MPRQNKIVIRNGTTTPSAVDFDTAEPAWDKTAGKLYIKDGGGNMVEVGAGGGGGGLTNFTESQSTYSNSVSSIFEASGTDTNINAVLSPKGNGALIAHEPDGTTAGGNARGSYAVDLQTIRTAATQVASGNYSIIPGGWSNIASSGYSVAMGSQNTSSGGSAHSYGYSNTSSGSYSFAFGVSNSATDTYAIAIGLQSTSSSLYSVAIGTRANTQGIKGLHAIAPIATTSSTYKNPQFYKVILTAVTPANSGDSGRRYLTTDGGSVVQGTRTESKNNSIYVGREDGTNSRQMYVEGIVKASKVGGGSNHADYAVWEISGFIRGAYNGSMQNTNVTEKFNPGSYSAPTINADFGSSGSGTSTEYWWRIRVDGSGSHSLLWTAYLTCYVTDEP
jgi:hypothetical protein